MQATIERAPWKLALVKGLSGAFVQIFLLICCFHFSLWLV